MALRYGYFDSEITGVDSEGMPIFDRAENSEFYALIWDKLITDGVLADPADCFQIIAGEGMTVIRKPGFGLVRGRFAYDELEAVLELSAAPRQYSRIDIVVLRCNYLERTCEVVVKEGEVAASPVPPPLEQPASGDLYELCLAEITINANMTAISQSHITDTRYDSSKCGVITQAIDHLETSVFYDQLNTFYDEFVQKTSTDYSISREQYLQLCQSIVDELRVFENQSEIDFNAWFQNVREQLSEDVAGRLQNEIDDLAAKIDREIVFTDDIVQDLQDGVASKHQLKITEFQDDGSIVENLADGRRKVTEFQEDGSILETMYSENSIVIWKNLTTFLEDGSIREEKIEV